MGEDGYSGHGDGVQFLSPCSALSTFKHKLQFISFHSLQFLQSSYCTECMRGVCHM